MTFRSRLFRSRLFRSNRLDSRIAALPGPRQSQHGKDQSGKLVSIGHPQFPHGAVEMGLYCTRPCSQTEIVYDGLDIVTSRHEVHDVALGRRETPRDAADPNGADRCATRPVYAVRPPRSGRSATRYRPRCPPRLQARHPLRCAPRCSARCSPLPARPHVASAHADSPCRRSAMRRPLAPPRSPLPLLLPLFLLRPLHLRPDSSSRRHPHCGARPTHAGDGDPWRDARPHVPRSKHYDWSDESPEAPAARPCIHSHRTVRQRGRTCP